MNAARMKLAKAQQSTESLLSIGLEPSPDYLPKEFQPNLQGYEEFLRLIIDATADLAPAFKINIAFFESLGWEGAEFLYAIRETIPDESFVIVDAKRGDIGSTAKHYAKALFDELGADAVTLNPLMGRDSAEPFLAYEDKLSYFLCLTSNPGADDFLLPNDLFATIASKVAAWSPAGNGGLVAGATRPDHLTLIGEASNWLPLLMPGIGAQGGKMEETIKASRSVIGGDHPNLLHVTRGILPDSDSSLDPGEQIRNKAEALRTQIDELIKGMTP